MSKPSPERTSRRRFLRVSAAATTAIAAPTFAPAVLAQAGNTQELRVGLVGCGGRGTGAALNAIKADPHVSLTATADLFEDHLQSSLKALREQAPDKVRVEPQRSFLGFDACQKLIDSGVDVVLLATPPAFRPQHLRAAVEAGKHTFVEITLGVDAPGVRSAMESAEIAAKKDLAIVSGFCWRYSAPLRAAREQIGAGRIGPVRAVYATYYRGELGHKYHGERPAGISDLEWQIRDWYAHLWLTGDITILLSGGHCVDKMTWWLDEVMPVKAVAVGSRVYAPNEGNTFDNCFVAYEYANGVRGFLGTRSQPSCYNENVDYVIGAKGECTIGRGRTPVITGENPWRYDGPPDNMYQNEHDELLTSIRSGKPINDGPRMARTTLMAIMGRMAAYTGQEITWQQALNSQDHLVPDKLDWNAKPPERPLAIPGIVRPV
jgi:predicted dehydrogenase